MYFTDVSACYVGLCRIVNTIQYNMSVQAFSSIAPDRRSRPGRDQHQKMRQSAGTTMPLVTWHHVSRVTRHVPLREPFEKKSNTAAAQTGGCREPKISDQKGLGLT